MVDQVAVKVGQIPDVVEPFRRIGATKARVLRHDHVVVLGQHVHEGQPVRRPRCAVQEQQGLALALAHDPDAASGHCLKCLLVRHMLPG